MKIAAALLSVILFSSCIITELGAQQYVINKTVTIPFSAFGGFGVAHEYLSVPPGRYIIVLSVERAPWDTGGNSVAEKVPIGIQCLLKEMRTGRDYWKTEWHSNPGQVANEVDVQPNCALHVYYSTLALTGARGRLTVEKI